MRVVRFFTAGLSLGIVLSLALVSQAQQPCSRIAFTGYNPQEQYTHIYSVNPDGTDLTQLTNEEGNDNAPAWSPDGTQIAFLRSDARGDESFFDWEYTLYVMDADGSNARSFHTTRLKLSTYYGSRISWSPDGQYLVYQAGEAVFSGAKEAIFVLALDPAAEDVTRVVVDGSTALSPTFLPDGSLGFVLSYVNQQSSMNIYRMDVDGRVRTRVSDFQYLEFAQSPAWSPDGEHIAFSYATTYRQMGDADPGDNALWVMDKDGSNARQIADNEREDVDPTWSPDGTQLAFNTHMHGLSYISVINADGAEQHLLIDPDESSFLQMQPAWSPFLPCDAPAK
jgi:Tol biopolymer transport system component